MLADKVFSTIKIMKNELINYVFLGKLIKHFRHQRKLKQNECCESITSVRTLYNIESGRYCSIEGVYGDLAVKLGFSFSESDFQIDSLDKYSRMIVEYFKQDRTVKEFSELCNRIAKAKRRAEGKLYIYELLDLYESYLNWFLHGDLSNRNLYYLIKKHVDYLSGNDRTIAMSFLLNYSLGFNKDTDYILYLTDVYKHSDIYANPYDIFRVEMSNDLAGVEHRYEAILKSRTEDPEWKKFSYRYCVYSVLAYASNNRYDQRGSLEYLEEIKNDAETYSKLPKHMYLQIVKRMGIRNFVLEDYEECCSLMSQVCEEDKSLLEMNYLLLFKSLELVDRTDEIIRIIASLRNDSLNLPMARNVIRYYKLKYLQRSSASELEKFLIEKLYYRMFENNTFFRDVLFNEMQQLVKETHNYKNLSLYLEKTT